MQRMAHVMAAPMTFMMAEMPVQRVAYEQPRAAERTCESSSSRLDQLEERFNRLYARVNTLQDSITQQTSILEKISEKLDVLEKRN
jgi:TolA-binding protein